MKRPLLFVLVSVVTAAAVACGGSKPAPQTTPTPQPSTNADSAAARARQDSIAAAAADSARRASEDADRVARQRTADSLAALGRATDAVRMELTNMIHFDYDKAALRPGDVTSLDQKIPLLQANTAVTIRIAGHCDERGSDEYNLALGNRRAMAAKQYLTSHGIDAGRITTVSYGKERPIDPGHDEDAWSKNRRDEFEITAGGDVLKQP
ncbi:MAG TPA: peptidoglycan-associated lipoprotein Pal [Gemmatimonadales bacterium]|nr:peptidoglycan-associated lipoprotein Pal [Gemmatimonadales bacterium]